VLFPAHNARLRRTSGGVTPANTVPPSITWALTIGSSPTLTPGTWTGSPSLTYSLRRDGVDVVGQTGRTEAQIEAYLATASDVVASGLVVREVDSVSATSADSNSVAYLPSIDPTALMWWDPSSVSGAVSSWVDQIASVAATQATGTKQPTASATAIGGSYPGVTSDGGDSLVASGAGAVLSGKSLLTITAVMRDAVSTNLVALELTTAAASNDGGFNVSVNGSSLENVIGTVRGTTASTVKRSSVETLSTERVVSVGLDASIAGAGAVVFIRVNGVSLSTTAVLSTNAAGTFANSTLYFFGRGATPSLAWPGTFGHVVLRESTSINDALESVERYAGARAGITW
jgi:hypothetical protein